MHNKTNALVTCWLSGALLLTTFSIMAQEKKVTEKEQAPAFTTSDVNGNAIKLTDYKGKKVLLSFYRNVGCPVCNLRFHELQNKEGMFKEKGLVVLAVYESTADNMKQYLEGESPYATLIPNPKQDLYELYQVDRSMGKMMKGMFHGAMGKMKEGKKLYRKKIAQDGNANRIGADFLIDENGNVANAYYGKYVGDHLPLNEIISFIN
jgi:thioredoxin-dependent peroxiredoxin